MASGINYVEIYNISGALLKSVEMESAYSTINISEFASGKYILVINSESRIIAKQLVISR